MIAYITGIRCTNPPSCERISHVQWSTPINGKSGLTSVPEFIKWLREAGNSAKVKVAGREVSVGIVEASPPYLRTYADGVYNDNLLSLPRV